MINKEKKTAMVDSEDILITIEQLCRLNESAILLHEIDKNICVLGKLQIIGVLGAKLAAVNLKIMPI